MQEKNTEEIPTHNSHNCPKCGTEETFCHKPSRYGYSDGPHRHKCPKCGQVWQHDPIDVRDSEIF